MTKEEAIKYLQQIYPNGGHCWLDEQRIEAISMAIEALKEEPVSDDLKKEVERYFDALYSGWTDSQREEDSLVEELCRKTAIHFANWQKENLWKPADGDDLPEIDREVIVLCNNGRVAFGHRPYKEKYIGKNLTTGNIETFENNTYDKGGWNIPDVKFWLDVKFPKEIEL